jgi:hypothetical protein
VLFSFFRRASCIFTVILLRFLLNLSWSGSNGGQNGSITNAECETLSKEAGTVTVKLDSTSTWALTADTYITSFDGDVSNIVTNGYTLYVNGTGLT